MELKDKLTTVGKVEIILTNVKTGKITRSWADNLVTDIGKISMADHYRGATASNKGIVTYCALGTDDTAPEPENIELGTEIFRKLISVRSFNGNSAILETFFTVDEGNGTLKEAGLFGDDASGVADSGTLFNHLAISRTKTTSDTLTLRWFMSFG